MEEGAIEIFSSSEFDAYGTVLEKEDLSIAVAFPVSKKSRPSTKVTKKNANKERNVFSSGRGAYLNPPPTTP